MARGSRPRSPWRYTRRHRAGILCRRVEGYDMDWNRIIDGYCERVGTDPNFWGEPVNAITNAAFLAAALWALHEARSRERLDWSTGLLCVNVFAIGVGSFLFHTFATRWAVMMDVVPIQTMILLYFAAVLIRAYALRWYWAIPVSLAFIPVSAGITFLLKGTLFEGANAGYIAALTLIAVNGAILRQRGHSLAGWLAAAAGIFMVSIFFRMIDEPVCSGFPLGTHFLWHILNGTVLGVLLVGYVRHCGRSIRA